MRKVGKIGKALQVQATMFRKEHPGPQGTPRTAAVFLL
jgi:hypothetical protein